MNIKLILLEFFRRPYVGQFMDSSFYSSSIFLLSIVLSCIISLASYASEKEALDLKLNVSYPTSVTAISDKMKLDFFIQEVERSLPPQMKKVLPKNIKIIFEDKKDGLEELPIPGNQRFNNEDNLVSLNKLQKKNQSVVQEVDKKRINYGSSDLENSTIKINKLFLKHILSFISVGWDSLEVSELAKTQTANFQQRISPDNKMFEDRKLKIKEIIGPEEFKIQHKTFYKTAKATLIHELAHFYFKYKPLDKYTKENFYNLTNWRKTGTLFYSRTQQNLQTDRSPDVYENKSPEETFAVEMEYFLLDPLFKCRRPSLHNLFSRLFSFVPFPDYKCDTVVVFEFPAYVDAVNFDQDKEEEEDEKNEQGEKNKENNENKEASDQLTKNKITSIKFKIPANSCIHYLLAERGKTMASKGGHSMFRIIPCSAELMKRHQERKRLNLQVRNSSSSTNISTSSISTSSISTSSDLTSGTQNNWQSEGLVEGDCPLECLQNFEHQFVVSFGAEVPENQVKAWAGVRGKYKSVLSFHPFEKILQKYTLLEFRSLTSYPLKLSESEREDFIYRLKELQVGYTGRYYFFSNNCAVEALGVLKGVVKGNDTTGCLLKKVVNTPYGLYDLLKQSKLLDETVLATNSTLRDWHYFAPEIAPINKAYSCLYDYFSLLKKHKLIGQTFLSSSMEDYLNSSAKYRGEFFRQMIKFLNPQLLRLEEIHKDKIEQKESGSLSSSSSSSISTGANNNLLKDLPALPNSCLKEEEQSSKIKDIPLVTEKLLAAFLNTEEFIIRKIDLKIGELGSYVFFKYKNSKVLSLEEENFVNAVREREKLNRLLLNHNLILTNGYGLPQVEDYTTETNRISAKEMQKAMVEKAQVIFLFLRAHSELKNSFMEIDSARDNYEMAFSVYKENKKI